MKKIHFFISLLAVLLVSLTTQATQILNEDFDYANGALAGNSSWTSIKYNTNSALNVIGTSLTFPGYQASAVGGSAALVRNDSEAGQGVHYTFENAVHTTVYASMLVNVTSAHASNGGVIAAFSKPGWGSSISQVGRLVVSSSGAAADKFKFGVGRGNYNYEYTTGEFDYGTTYLVVMRYTVVDGTSNDEVAIFVDQITEGAADATASGNNYSSEMTSKGLTGIGIYQGLTFSNYSASATIDALRVGEAWDDLFDSAPANTDPTIMANSTINFNTVVCGYENEFTLNIKGKNLTQDITLSPLSSIFTLSETTVSMADAQSATGKDIIITLNATEAQQDATTETLNLTTEGASTKAVTISWASIKPTVLNTLSAYQTAPMDPDIYYDIRAQNMQVSLVISVNNENQICLQDATGGIIIKDTYGAVSSLPTVNQTIDAIFGTQSTSWGTHYFTPGMPITFKDAPAPIIPTETTISALTANPLNFEARLITLKGVTLTQADVTEFTYGDNPTIHQGSESITLRMIDGASYIGESIPTGTLDITGVITSGSGKVLAIRSMSDIKVQGSGTNLENATSSLNIYTDNGVLYINNEGSVVEVYNTLGARVAYTTNSEITLPNGVYFVRCNNTMSKIAIQ